MAKEPEVVDPFKGRKLKKTDKARLSGWYDHNRAQLRDTTIQFMAAEAAREFGGDSSVLIASETSNLLIGLPLPSIALEWVLANSVFPLSQLIQIVGLPGTCKSALIYEILWWFQCHGGAGVLIENEDKISMTLLNSIFQYTATGVIKDQSHSLEEWQRKVQYWIKRFREKMDGTNKDPGPGRVFPIGIAVDSLMSKAATEIPEKGEKEGHFGRNYPLEAGSIKTFMQAVPQKVANLPIALLSTNHLKPKKDENTGRAVDHTPGGFAVEFQDALILKTDTWKKNIRTASFNGKGVSIKCIKNSLGEGDRDILTRILWWHEEYADTKTRTTRRRQVTKWDWGWTTIRFLTNLTGEAKARVMEVVDLHVGKSSDVECSVYSKKLGATKDKPLSWARAGERIQEDPELLKKLRDALDIHIGNVFDPSIDYRVQRKRLQKALP